MWNVRVSVFALMATVSTDGSVMLSWTTVVSTLLLTLLHCCGSIPTPPVVNEAGATPTLLEMRAATSHLERAAGAALAETGDAVQVVGGDGLVLLLDEAEGREVEAGLLTLPVLQHGGELVYGAPFNRRRTSQLPHLHMDTYRQCINGRKVWRWNQNAPTGLISSWASVSMLVCFQGLKLKKKKVKISSWTATLQGLGEMFRLGGNSQVIGRAVWEDWTDLRDKQVKGGGVGRLWIDRGVTPVQQDKVPVKREWGPQHRVRDSRSQVESSHLQSYQGPFVRLLQTVRDGKARFRHAGFHPFCPFVFEQPGPAFIKRLRACRAALQVCKHRHPRLHSHARRQFDPIGCEVRGAEGAGCWRAATQNWLPHCKCGRNDEQTTSLNPLPNMQIRYLNSLLFV